MKYALNVPRNVQVLTWRLRVKRTMATKAEATVRDQIRECSTTYGSCWYLIQTTGPQGGSYPAGGYGQDDDLQGAAEHASRHAGSSGDSSMFSNLLGSLSQNKGRLANEDVDEDGKLGVKGLISRF